MSESVITVGDVYQFQVNENDSFDYGRYASGEETEHCRLSDTCDLPRNHGPACRVLLGHDRNGREVRLGDRVRDKNGISLKVQGITPSGDFYGGGWHCPAAHSELVTGEKPAQTDIRRALRDLLDQAEQGKLEGIFIAATYKDGDVSSTCVGEKRYTLWGAAFEGLIVRAQR